jgi:uncharacterized membrane protein (DUF106 family)
MASILDPVLNPLLALPVFWVVIVMSFFITVIITTIYKYTTDQDLMKSLKSEMKELQAEMKELKHDPKKMMEVQKKAMATNTKYMGQSLKSTLYTFVPIILLFGWMNANLAFEPINPQTEFSTSITLENRAPLEITLIAPKDITIVGDSVKTASNGEASWLLKGKAGTYLLQYDVEENSYDKELVISDEQAYAKPEKSIRDDVVDTISIDHQPQKLLNIFGWKIGWLGTYIIFSIIFSTLLRKLFKVY